MRTTILAFLVTAGALVGCPPQGAMAQTRMASPAMGGTEPSTAAAVNQDAFDKGMAAFAKGDYREASFLFREQLHLDLGNEKVHAYLERARREAGSAEAMERGRAALARSRVQGRVGPELLARGGAPWRGGGPLARHLEEEAYPAAYRAWAACLKPRPGHAPCRAGLDELEHRAKEQYLEVYVGRMHNRPRALRRMGAICGYTAAQFAYCVKSRHYRDRMLGTYDDPSAPGKATEAAPP